jgi:hypothetical protein
VSTPPHPDPAQGRRSGAPTRRAAELSLIQAAMRRRVAERAFEDYVREMARRWAPAQQDGTSPGEPPPLA